MDAYTDSSLAEKVEVTMALRRAHHDEDPVRLLM